MGETEIAPGVFYGPSTGARAGATPQQREVQSAIPGEGTTGFAAVESPGFMENLRRREGQLRGPIPGGSTTGLGQYPSHIQQALGSEFLAGDVLTPRRSFPALGALRFPSAQALRTMTPTERAFFTQALAEQGVSGSNLDTYLEQMERTIRPAGRKQATFGFATGRL